MADNKIVFLNAYKMKISIIIGVFHMLFGVSLSLKNYRYQDIFFFSYLVFSLLKILILSFYFRYFNNYLSIYCEFIPQLIFLLFLFFYMVVLMFMKWIIYYPESGKFIFNFKNYYGIFHNNNYGIWSPVDLS